MITNLKSFSARVNETSVSFQFSINNIDDTSCFYILLEEMKAFKNCFFGENKYFPWFDDIGSIVRPHPDGFQFLKHTYEDNFKKMYIDFPFKKWLRLHKFLTELKLNETIELTEEENKSLSESVKPRIEINFNDIEKGYWDLGIYKTYIEHSLSFSISKYGQLYPYLLESIKSLKRIAENHSNGNLVIVDLYFDSLPYQENPDSYYFVIHGEFGGVDKKVMNGGIIYHKSSNDYSMHT